MPEGEAIDASQPEEWAFPVGTRFWKEFSFEGSRVETRFSPKLPDGSFRFAAYVWGEGLGDGVLAPASGRAGVHPLTGLGNWSRDTFIQTVRSGRHLGRGRPLLPPMPIPAYQNFTDEELGAVFAYLQSIPAIENQVPEPLPPPGALKPRG